MQYGQALLWVFPPFPLIGAVINKLLLEQVNAIVILPRFLRFWTAMLRKLPVFAVHEMVYSGRLYTIGCINVVMCIYFTLYLVGLCRSV